MNQVDEVMEGIPDSRIPEIREIKAVPTMLHDGHSSACYSDIVAIFHDGGRTVLATMLCQEWAEEIVVGARDEIEQFKKGNPNLRA